MAGAERGVRDIPVEVRRRSIASTECARSGIPPSRKPRGRRPANQIRRERALGIPHATPSVSSLLGQKSPHMVIQNIGGHENMSLVTHEISIANKTMGVIYIFVCFCEHVSFPRLRGTYGKAIVSAA